MTCKEWSGFVKFQGRCLVCGANALENEKNLEDLVLGFIRFIDIK